MGASFRVCLWKAESSLTVAPLLNRTREDTVVRVMQEGEAYLLRISGADGSEELIQTLGDDDWVYFSVDK